MMMEKAAVGRREKAQREGEEARMYGLLIKLQA